MASSSTLTLLSVVSITSALEPVCLVIAKTLKSLVKWFKGAIKAEMKNVKISIIQIIDRKSWLGDPYNGAVKHCLILEKQIILCEKHSFQFSLSYVSLNSLT